MPINKIMDKNGNVLLDLSVDTIEPSKVLEGYTFHDRTGTMKVGTLPVNSSEIDYESETIFYDYDGTIVAHMPWSQAKVLAELPEAPDHTDDNLTFDGWNYTLEEIHSFDGPLDIGACYRTTDDYTYIYWDVKYSSNITISFRFINSSNSTTEVYLDNELVHTQTSGGNALKSITLTPGKHTIKMHSTGTTATYGWTGDSYTVVGNNGGYAKYITGIKLSSQVFSIKYIVYRGFCPIEKINIPINVAMPYVSTNYAMGLPNLKHLTWSRDTTTYSNVVFPYMYSLKSLSIPPTLDVYFNMTQNYYVPRLILPNVKVVGNVTNSNTFKNIGILKTYNVTAQTTAPDSSSKAYVDRALSDRCIDYINNVQKCAAALLEAGYEIQLYGNQEAYADAPDVYNMPDGIKKISGYFPLYIGRKRVVVGTGLTYINSLYYSQSGNYHSMPIIDMTKLESVPSLASSPDTSNCAYTIIVPHGMYQQFEAATNWSTLCALGMVEEAPE